MEDGHMKPADIRELFKMLYRIGLSQEKEDSAYTARLFIRYNDGLALLGAQTTSGTGAHLTVQTQIPLTVPANWEKDRWFSVYSAGLSRQVEATYKGKDALLQFSLVAVRDGYALNVIDNHGSCTYPVIFRSRNGGFNSPPSTVPFFTVGTSVFLKAIKKAYSALSRAPRDNLNGIHIEMSEGMVKDHISDENPLPSSRLVNLTLVGTDGSRLNAIDMIVKLGADCGLNQEVGRLEVYEHLQGLHSAEIQGEPDTWRPHTIFGHNIPDAAAKLLLRVLKRTGSLLTDVSICTALVWASVPSMTVASGGWKLSFPLQPVSYPRWRGLLREAGEYQSGRPPSILLDRADLLEKSKAMVHWLSAWAGPRTGVMEIETMSGGVMKLSAYSSLKQEVTRTCSVIYLVPGDTGQLPARTIGVNPWLLRDALECCTDSNVSIQFGKGVLDYIELWTPGHLCILMPLRLD